MIAGAAGTSALNITTYLDMAIRARPASTTPEQSVQRLADLIGVDLADGEQAKTARPVSGRRWAMRRAWRPSSATAYWPGAEALASRDAGPDRIMVGSTTPMTVLGVTDPRRWTAAEWAADLVLHLAYGTVAAAANDHLC